MQFIMYHAFCTRHDYTMRGAHPRSNCRAVSPWLPASPVSLPRPYLGGNTWRTLATYFVRHRLNSGPHPHSAPRQPPDGNAGGTDPCGRRASHSARVPFPVVTLSAWLLPGMHSKGSGLTTMCTLRVLRLGAPACTPLYIPALRIRGVVPSIWQRPVTRPVPQPPALSQVDLDGNRAVLCLRPVTVCHGVWYVLSEVHPCHCRTAPVPTTARRSLPAASSSDCEE